MLESRSNSSRSSVGDGVDGREWKGQCRGGRQPRVFAWTQRLRCRRRRYTDVLSLLIWTLRSAAVLHNTLPTRHAFCHSFHTTADEHHSRRDVAWRHEKAATMTWKRRSLTLRLQNKCLSRNTDIVVCLVWFTSRNDRPVALSCSACAFAYNSIKRNRSYCYFSPFKSENILKHNDLGVELK